MVLKINPKHLFVGLGVLSFLGLLLFGGTLAYVVLFDRQVANYPGSSQVSSHDVVKLSPHLYYRQDTAYLTGDYIPSVFHWYTNGFGLGSDAHGQDNCISMYSKETQSRITKVMRVTVCDTVNKRMIFVQRTIELK
ncbi:MAG TPA: hypothetical protein VI451_15190 [Anaerolineales bacterium]|nr:hypothetical protein [Anaerolineales bacterium]